MICNWGHRSTGAILFPEYNETLTEVPPGICSHITPSSRTPSLAERAFSSSFPLQRPCTVTQEFIQSVINPLCHSASPSHWGQGLCKVGYSYELRLLLFLVHWEDRIGIYLYWHTSTPSPLLTFSFTSLPPLLCEPHTVTVEVSVRISSWNFSRKKKTLAKIPPHGAS